MGLLPQQCNLQFVAIVGSHSVSTIVSVHVRRPAVPVAQRGCCQMESSLGSLDDQFMLQVL
jgi:hypothetical protein